MRTADRSHQGRLAAGTVMLVLVWVAGCTGAIGDDRGGDPPSDDRGDDDSPGPTPDSPTEPNVPRVPDCSGPPDVGRSLVLRLSRVEYDNTVRDLLGDASRPASAFSADGVVAGFPANALSPPAETELEQYRVAADALAAQAMARPGALLPCASGSAPGATCAKDFIATFGRRAFRRPLETDEVTAYLSLFETGLMAGDFKFGLELVLRAMLQSPNFLYRIEVGRPVVGRPGLVALTGYELASRLSYMLWRSMPDEALLEAAGSGRLDTRDGLEAEVRRMLESPSARGHVNDALAAFADGWLGLDALDDIQKVGAAAKAFAALAPDMRSEGRTFLQKLALEGDGKLATALTATFTFATPALAEFYGARGSTQQGVLSRVELPADQPRAGLLTQAGLMSRLAHETTTSPVNRGQWVRTALLCRPTPPPPPDVPNSLPMLDEDLPARQRLALHATDPGCAPCHRLLDGIGFAFEHFDAVGAFRTMDGAQPVDARGELFDTDVDGPLDGARSLAERLAASAQVESCFARQWFRFSFGRAEQDADECTVESITQRLRASDGDIREVLVALATHESIRYRRIEEVTP